ncbi:oxidoreductase [Flavobacterium akiainvivens]|uniref:Oxidoreductase n=1 Tax=Flavobacterium akiainvivens TaxID=1202724 RepID=A0A0M8MAX3_9FLAO|nr:3-oxoacyl-ACP reductase family protein [Flavobacterium akiainvivens]KOS04854.1 oxidoreductase [Flavobacterium akiainvivens]SFQ43239.1 3-oxoacyl-[acyl-carrier protein] reductase [Flavobacterium akiainvivens]
MPTLKGKVALVTGGSRGIGAGIVSRLAREGANVAFTYVSSKEKAEELKNELEKLEVSVLPIKADTGNQEQIDVAVKEVANAFGSIDILVNSSGLFITGQIDAADDNITQFRKQWDVNVHGAVYAVRSVLPYMGSGGRIINIGSTGGARTPYAGIGDYAATKAALGAYTRSWARDLGSRNITVNIIQPGLIDTDMNPADGPFSATMLQAVALGHYGEPEDIAGTVAFLAGNDAKYITGATLNVDGGQTT